MISAVESRIKEAYGFIADTNKSTLHNASDVLAQMPEWYYFDKPQQLAFHDLTTHISPPKNLSALLGLGLKFCPTPRYTTTPSTLLPTLQRFQRDIFCKTFYAGKEFDQDEEFNKSFYIKSNYSPKEWMIAPTITKRLKSFSKAASSIFYKRHCRNNMLWHQRKALQYLQTNNDLIIVTCDKNLGPAVIEKATYIKRAYSDHLNDKTSYQQLDPTNAVRIATELRLQLQRWIKNNTKLLSKAEKKFLIYHLAHNKDPFPVFYMTMKVHKTPWKTRPIVSCSGSLLQPLGIWVDRKLQQVACKQQSYLKSSKDLKSELIKLHLPSNATLFTADAISMYTNIHTDHAIASISEYLRDHEDDFKDVPVEALIDALTIIMTNNVFTFGDTLWHQTSGTAMGTPPAPPYATLYYAIHEDTILADHSDNLLYYKRYIDDVFGIWLPTDDADELTWSNFKDEMNYVHLNWEHTPRSTSVDFLDLTIYIKNNRVHTTLFEKKLNLYLYLPPHSAHPPGVLNGLIMGNMNRINTLCSNETDINSLTRAFYGRLIARGYKKDTLLPIFNKVIQLNSTRKNVLSEQLQHQCTDPVEPDPVEPDIRLFFHLRYNPYDPKSSRIQELWRKHLAQPSHGRQLKDLSNKEGFRIGINRLTVAYSRPLNIGNILSYRKMDRLSGPPVSSYQTITN